MRESALRAFRHPVAPGFGRRVAAVEDEAAARVEMCCDHAQRRRLVVPRQEHLKGVAGEQHQVEAAAEPEVTGVSLDPRDPVAARPSPCHLAHHWGRVDRSDWQTYDTPFINHMTYAVI